MTLKHVVLLGFILLFGLASYLTLRPASVIAAPPPRTAHFFLFQSQCPITRFFEANAR